MAKCEVCQKSFPFWELPFADRKLCEDHKVVLKAEVAKWIVSERIHVQHTQ